MPARDSMATVSTSAVKGLLLGQAIETVKMIIAGFLFHQNQNSKSDDSCKSISRGIDQYIV